MQRWLKFDLLPGQSSQERTYLGGLLSLLSLFLAFCLLFAEFSDYMTVTVDNQLVVDTDRHDQMEIRFNITFPRLPCAFMSIDALDIAGTVQLDVNSTVYKQRLDTRGGRIRKTMEPEETKLQSEMQLEAKKDDVPVPQNVNGCGTCYGAESATRKCCETCEDIRQAYREKGWSFSNARNMAQCINEGYMEKLLAQKNEGCRIFGSVSVDQVGGNFHISPGTSYATAHGHFHDTSTFDYDQEFDLSHEIHSLSFGDDSYLGHTNPLDGMKRNTDAKNSLYQYFIKVVPTSYTTLDNTKISTNRYSATHHYQVIDNASSNHEQHGFPGVYFIYDLSPIEVNLVETSQPFAKFFTSACAIVGGVFTIFRVVDQLLHQGVRTIRKSQEGKIL